MINDCVDLCYQVAAAVFPVVGSESPEGYIPNVLPNMALPKVYQEKYEALLQAMRKGMRSRE